MKPKLFHSLGAVEVGCLGTDAQCRGCFLGAIALGKKHWDFFLARCQNIQWRFPSYAGRGISRRLDRSRLQDLAAQGESFQFLYHDPGCVHDCTGVVSP